jgi:hypothetical protein
LESDGYFLANGQRAFKAQCRPVLSAHLCHSNHNTPKESLMPNTLTKFYQRLLGRFHQPDLKNLPVYGHLFFDHLKAGYTTQDLKVENPKENDLLLEIDALRKSGSLTWKDIYTFDLIIARTLEGEKLRNKVTALRYLYRSVAAQKDYELYIASKPPDPSESGTPEEKLRQDCLYLLDQFYLEYSMRSAQESMRNHLLQLATFIAVLIIVLGASITYINNRGLWGFGQGITTLSVVMFAGVVGALVSMQQRIQASPSEGEPLHNFAMLTHGKFGIFLSPISGGIFAAVLYLMFTGGLMTGAIFPEIGTISRPCIARPTPTPTPTPTPAQQQQQTPAQQQQTPAQQQQPPAQQQQQTSAQQQQQPPAQPQPEQQPQTRSIIALLHEFLRETGPCGGHNYALLVIWAFLAGFAERLVPDALNRLIAKSGS